MRCHYEILGLQLTATNDEIKKAYRKCALQWHPDKHVGSSGQEEAQKKFLEVQDAYETLIDPQERAWYDSHREVLINGGTPGEKDDSIYTFNIYPFFSPTCFRGYEDDDKGFYAIYREMFLKIAEEDRQYYDEGTIIPEFGTSTSDYDSIVGPFYAFWMSYCTPRSFVWKEEYDTREAQDRNVRRAMEKENKKLRDKAKKERNEEIRKIVSIVRKRDKRVEQYKKLLEEKALLAQKKSEEKREADRQRRVEQMKNYVEPEWSAVDKKLEELDLAEKEATRKTNRVQNSDSENENQENSENLGEDQEEDDDFDESLFCVACNKSFKNTKSFENHERSKKHRENIELLKKHMKEEDKNALFGEENEEEIEQKNDTNRPKLSKKQKKKRKQNKNLENSSDEENDEDKSELTTDSIEVEIKQEENKENNEIKEASKKEKKKTKSSEPEKIVKEEVEEEVSGPKPAVCSVCDETFESRTKLFAHIKEEGHAAIKTDQPVSHNAMKKNKRLLKQNKK